MEVLVVVMPESSVLTRLSEWSRSSVDRATESRIIQERRFQDEMDQSIEGLFKCENAARSMGIHAGKVVPHTSQMKVNLSSPRAFLGRYLFAAT